MALSNYHGRSEVFLSKEDDQLWLRRDDNGWDVVCFDGRYRGVAEVNWQDVPDYALTGWVGVSQEGVVEANLVPNSNYDEQKIEACALRG